MDRRSREYPASKPSVVVDWTLACAHRRELRKAIAEKWSEEDPYTSYCYNVERCLDGSKVYLLRPTWLNKGFDFQVNIEGLVKVLKVAKGGTREMPSHGDVIHDLQTKANQRPKRLKILFNAVGAVYECAEPPAILADIPDVAEFTVGWPVDQSLYAIKWLFIEQDVTYWLQRGRDMLMSAIEEQVFKLPAR